MRNKTVFFVFLLIVPGSCMVTQKSNQPTFAPNPVVAHRGAWKKNNLPENSIAALKEAIRWHCTGSEFDIWMTADDSLVVNHDPHYHNLPIEKTTYASLLAFPLSNGEKIPTLREYLLAGLDDNHQTRLVLEIKPSTISPDRGKWVAGKVLELVKTLNAAAMSMYISFDYGILQRILEADPNAHTQYLKGDVAPAQLKKDGIAGLDYHYSVFKKETGWVADAKKEKLRLNAWTVNDAKEMEGLLDQGFHYITTNEPERLFEIIQQRSKK